MHSLNTTQKIGDGGVTSGRSPPASARSTPESPGKLSGKLRAESVPEGRVQSTEDVDSDANQIGDRGVALTPAAGKKTVQRRRAPVQSSLAAKGASPRPISVTHF